ncbi:DHHC palmitoyltransferase-domain-containing protein [Cyathus striatus]|nr:DHHC palmitoyltransferase-domain-containing protein [Cyathus striatus]
MICAKRVFRCFKTLERWGDKLTGFAGPYFVALAVGLLTTGIVCFFEVIAPTLALPLITLPLCVLIAANILVHYYYVCTVRPGFVNEPPQERGTGILWAKPKSGKKKLTRGVKWNKEVKITPASTTRCRKCSVLRPEADRVRERAHHCRICNRCVLKYDHHWINQCVGLHNERHFVMFMLYLVTGSFFFGITGYSKFLECLGVSYSLPWQHRSPEILFAMVYILALVMCFAVGVMVAYHIWSVSNGETAVEAQDFEVYRNRAKARDEAFVNSYDVGRKKNLQLFFNIGENGYPWYTLIIPLRIMPYTDGRSWARKEGYETHAGLRNGEEVTDDEGEEERED